MQDYFSVIKNLKQSVKPWDRIENVAITQALGRYLAKDIIAKENFPKNPTSSMDGYAFKFNENIHELKIIADLPAGSNNKITIKENECVKTFTGSTLSINSDTVIPIENVKIDNNIVHIIKPVSKGFAIRQIGESYKVGEVLLKRGTKLGYAEIALLAELGCFHISVLVKPKVAIISTGNEIKDLGENLEHDGQIRSSNHIAIATMARQMGCESIICPIAKDDPIQIKQAFKNAINIADIVVSTGGVSVGDYDFTKDLIGEFVPIVDKVAIKPGRHIKIAKYSPNNNKNLDLSNTDKLIMALPGFSYSAIVTFLLFFRPILFSMITNTQKYEFEAILNSNFTKKSKLLEFVPCKIEFKDGKIYANIDELATTSSGVTNKLLNDVHLCIIDSDKKINDIVKIVKIF